MAGHRGGHAPFRSKAQWRFAWSSHKTWARKWAHETPSYRALPGRVTVTGVGSAQRHRIARGH